MNDRIDFSTSDDPVQLEQVSGIRSKRHSGDVLLGGHPEDAPGMIQEQFEEKTELVGASPDGGPDAVEFYESGQDDGQIV